MSLRVPELPTGFLAAGINAGIKNSKRDLGVLVSDRPAVFAACLTQNRCAAHAVNRTRALLGVQDMVRVLITTSGNANAMTGEEGKEDDQRIARELAEEVGVDPSEVVTASTGVIGHRLPLSRILDGIPVALRSLSENPSTFAESVMTTDRTQKVFAKEVFFAGTLVQIHAVAKGSGMIAPALATTLCFITTDAAISVKALRRSLSEVVAGTLNQLTVDGDMSTNDAVVMMANGAADNELIEEGTPNHEWFTDALRELLVEVARSIAKDGEGATRMIEVSVEGAKTLEDARQLAVSVADSSLVKAAVFGADPYAWGRILASLGARAGRIGADFDPATLSLTLQGVKVFDAGKPVKDGLGPLKFRMAEREIAVHARLGRGGASAKAWGCDLTYDYVKINADYARATTTSADGSVSVQDRLSDLGPTIKTRILIEALRYIDRFDGLRAVIKFGGEAMLDRDLEEQFADDVLLLQSVGLRPIVVHGGGAEISRLLEKLGHKSEFVDGLRVTDVSSMAVVEMVLTGSVNQRLVAALNRRGRRGVGLSGKDGGLLRAKKLVADRDLGQVGEVVAVETSLIDMLERDGYIPVISPIGLGDDGTAYNINADLVAAELAVALKAPKLIYLTDTPGLADGDQLVSELTADGLKARLERGDLAASAQPKLKAALSALRAGVNFVHLVDGRVPHNLVAELFTDRGVGTLIRQA
ncbi:MAG: bifunctional glutamate N-acetyltransferase/amino-acid acetyltransferase ArgJ [Myxococcota bacterium]